MNTEKSAMFFNKIGDLKVECFLCPHNCVIKPGKLGLCRVRKNIKGTLYSLNYGKVTSIALDPIEKKPLNNFKSGSLILSAGTFGCNLKCSFCQNWTVAHERPVCYDISPEKLVNKALEFVPDGNTGIAFTYNEPSVWYEFVYDTSILIKETGLSNVLVTNGYIDKRPLEKLIPFVDAMNIDLKAYTNSFYKDVCKGYLNNVKETIQFAAKKCHLEITMLVIPGLNDSIEDISLASKWLSSVSPDIVLHLTRFFPNYKMKDVLPTPRETLENAGEEALKYLNHVYLGNI
ncbi:AmmeMemoRadiSam system radical SAM enzyme [Herbivorax sp. ANBcel31]|uniref:AmmeMemoRadiSam system radical SAM enzyme n=1 Tax=Herbivorax sp. ANBcel31 TaxID=3069754 RepID=UPI0027B59704|nr:AmmeMemoRadiSam system radical SAM enzyme [Herbivorax sp. ANBcel31]MDQ2087345.1 AmmeMemoRadiSam system radical SAM enzyme [Herbivorax sp. ANBcel31]